MQQKRNLSFSLQKIVDVTDINKGDKSQTNHYRPISLLNHLSQIFEKILKKRLNAFVNKYNTISKKQFGYEEHVSTEDALLKLTPYDMTCS